MTPYEGFGQSSCVLPAKEVVGKVMPVFCWRAALCVQHPLGVQMLGFRISWFLPLLQQ